MQVLKNVSKPERIAVLLFENFSNHCLANAIEPFRAANTIARASLYEWKFLSVSGGPVASSSGLPVETGRWTDLKPSGDYLFIMPSYGYKEYATPQTLQLLRAARVRFKSLVGMDAGSWLLARAGLLHGRRATIHWDERTQFAETFPDVQVLEDRFVIEPDLASCGGASTSMELVLEFIKARHSSMFALEVAALFMHGDRFEFQNPYQRVSSDILINSAAALMRRTIEAPLTISEIADRLNVDQRHLETVFAALMGLTPRAVYKAIRLREARRLVELSNLSIAEIAMRCGYQNASAMTRAYRAEFGDPPRRHRQ